MAEIDTSSGGKKKASTKVDMTPMVDLGFLLITFFMLTTTMSKPKTMEIIMPDKTPEKIEAKVIAKNTITLLLDKDNSIYWYRAELNDDKPLKDLKKVDYSRTGIRKTLLDLRKEIGAEVRKEKDGVKNKKGETDWAIVVVIKPTDRSKYRNMVDILDEMNICDIQKYAIVDMSEADKSYLLRYFDKYEKNMLK